MLPGTYAVPITLATPKTLTIVATGATDTAAAGFNVEAGVNLTVQGMTFTTDVLCGTFTSDSTVLAYLTLRSCTFPLAGGYINNNYCTLVVSESVFTDSTVEFRASTVTVDRDAFYGTLASDVDFIYGTAGTAPSTLTVTNSVFTNSPSANTDLDSAIDWVQGDTVTIAFNTFYDAPAICEKQQHRIVRQQHLLRPRRLGRRLHRECRAAHCTFGYNIVQPAASGAASKSSH